MPLCATMAKFGQEFHFPPSSDGRQIPFGDNDADRGATSAQLERQQKPPSLRFATLPLHVVLSGVTHSNRPPSPYRHLYCDQERASEERRGKGDNP